MKKIYVAAVSCKIDQTGLPVFYTTPKMSDTESHDEGMTEAELEARWLEYQEEQEALHEAAWAAEAAADAADATDAADAAEGYDSESDNESQYDSE